MMVMRTFVCRSTSDIGGRFRRGPRLAFEKSYSRFIFLHLPPTAAIRPPHENESFLVRRMLIVTDEGTAQIIERALRLLERHAVFPEIRGRFLRVPLELAGHWWL